MPIMFRNRRFCMLGPWDFSSGRNLIFAEVSDRVRYGGPQVRSLRRQWKEVQVSASSEEVDTASGFKWKHMKTNGS